MRSRAKLDVNSKICIIGAGPSGLAAAEALREKGYRNITIFEKKNRVGGQSLSELFPVAGNKHIVYDRGSLAPLSGRKFKQLMKQYAVNYGKKGMDQKLRIKVLYKNKTSEALLDHKKYKLLGIPLRLSLYYLADFLKFSFYLLKYRRLAKPGLNNFKYLQETSIPYSQWIDDRKFFIMGPFLKVIGSLSHFSNSGYVDNRPIFQTIKLFLEGMKPPTTYVRGIIRPVREGFQTLWKRVAQNHDIRLCSNIDRITRATESHAPITIELDGKTHTYDKLIIACLPSRLMNILDLNNEEQDIFSRIKTSQGWRCAFTAKNLPHDAIYNFFENSSSSTPQSCLQSFVPEGRVTDDSWLYSCFLSSEREDHIDLLLQHAETKLIQYYGATSIEWVSKTYWPEYCAYFDCSDSKLSYYDKAESLQGKNNTYHINEMVHMGSHSMATEYAYNLVKKFF